MRAGSFAKLTQDKENTTQVTFHYVEGQAETFTIPIPAQELVYLPLMCQLWTLQLVLERQPHTKTFAQPSRPRVRVK